MGVRAVETMAMSAMGFSLGLVSVSAEFAPVAGELQQQLRTLPPIALGVVKAPHGGGDNARADLIGILHGSAAPARKAEAIDRGDVDIGGADGDALLDLLCALVDHGIDAARDDLLRRDLARREALLPAIGGDH